MTSEDSNIVKCVVVGDGTVGKTSMLVSYCEGKFPEKYIPTVFDNYEAEVMIGGERKVKFTLWDTAGQESYERIRLLSYPNTDVFLVCFSVVDPRSFQNVQEKWALELRRYSPRTPIIVVGTKKDLRADPQTFKNLALTNKSPITQQQGEEQARSIGAMRYMECSALTSEGLKNVFDTALLSVLDQRRLVIENQTKKSRKESGCTIL